MIPDPLPTLSRVFGFPAFRGVQADVVERVLAGERTLGVMPTGAGKSLCYQLPSVMLEGTCVVVSPLIALMHDQLRAAEAVGIRAATLTSADQNRAESIARFKAGELDMDVGALQYYYPGANGANTTELYVAGTYGPVTAKYSGTVSKGYFGLGKEYLSGEGRGTGYFNLAFAQEVAPKTTFKAAVGYTSYKSGAKNAGIPNYVDYSVGAAYDLGDGLTLNGAVQGANKKNSYVYAIDQSKSINRATLVVTVTKAL